MRFYEPERHDPSVPVNDISDTMSTAVPDTEPEYWCPTIWNKQGQLNFKGKAAPKAAKSAPKKSNAKGGRKKSKKKG